ncbi:hypothetical protein ACIBCN_04175 [Nocardia sp. NPDC051052]|uniref:hypothetical protein n=1 Tax=Nocardia sp. NPDC051052 TaxID=3364322 RepID=UPI00379D1B42
MSRSRARHRFLDTAAIERCGVEPGKARFIIDVVLAIHRRAMPRWLAEPDATLSQLMAQATAELRESGRATGSDGPPPRKASRLSRPRKRLTPR